MTERGITEHIIWKRAKAFYKHPVLIDTEIKTVGDDRGVSRSALDPDEYKHIIEAMKGRRDSALFTQRIRSSFWLILLLGMVVCAVHEWRLEDNGFVTTVLCLYGCVYCARYSVRAIDSRWKIFRHFSSLKSGILSYHARRLNGDHQD